MSTKQLGVITYCLIENYDKLIAEQEANGNNKTAREYRQEKITITAALTKAFNDQQALVKLKNACRREIQKIERQCDVGNWDYLDVDRMDSNDAFNRGFYRAFKTIV